MPDQLSETQVVDTIQRTWAKFLGVSEVGPDERYFDLGGDSLRGGMIIARLSTIFDRRLTLNDIYDTGTPKALADRLLQMDATPAPADLAASMDGLSSTASSQMLPLQYWYYFESQVSDPRHFTAETLLETGPPGRIGSRPHSTRFLIGRARPAELIPLGRWDCVQLPGRGTCGCAGARFDQRGGPGRRCTCRSRQ